jgi:adenine-specific DNA-methyltransferase
MDYVESVTAKRVQMINKEFDEDSTLWGGNNSFLYMELAQANQKLVEEIEAATDTKSLQQIWKQMQEKGFMSYKVKPSEIDKNVALYEELSLDDQKRFLIECLDKNLLYVPFEEIDDATYQMSEHDKQLTRQFYARR